MALQENTQLNESPVNLEEMQKDIQVGPGNISQEELISNLNMDNRVQVAQAEQLEPIVVTDGDQRTTTSRRMVNTENIPTLKQRVKPYDIRPQIESAEKQRLAERLKYEMLPNHLGHLYRDYGSFSSSLDLENEDVKVAVNPDGELVYSGVFNTIRTNPAIVGQENTRITSYPLPPNSTREDLVDAAYDMNTGIRNSGDLTYDPNRDFFKGDGLLAVKLAEETTTVQGLRGLLDAAPMALLVANSKAWNTVLKGQSWWKVGGKMITAIPTVGLGYYLLGEAIKSYGDGKNLGHQGWVSALHDLQEAELSFRNSGLGKQLGFEYDPEKINTGEGLRTFTKEQYASLLDPAFADFYVKLANSLTENVASVLSFGFAGGAMKLSPWNTNNINKLRKQATDNVENRSKGRVSGGFKPLSYDPTTKEGKANISREMGSIIDRELKDMKDNVSGAVFRFVNGFNKTQIQQQLQNPFRYWFEVGAGESVGSGLQSLAAYYSWGSDRTQTVDKLPYLIVGGVLGPWTLAKSMTGVFGGYLSPVKYATDLFRVIAEPTEGYARTMAGRVVSGKSTSLLTGQRISTESQSYLAYIDQEPKSIPIFVDFLQGKTGTKTLPLGLSNDQREGLIKLKEQLNLIDDEMSGGLLISMQAGLEQAQTAKEIAARYGIKLTVEETIGTFVKLQVIQGLEKYLVDTTITGSKADISSYNLAKEELLTMRSQALSETNELLDKMLRVTEEGGKDVGLTKMIDGLQSEVIAMEKSSGQMNELINMAFGIQVQDALRALQKNPYSTAQINKVKYLLSTDLGKELKLSFDGIDIPTEAMIENIDAIITRNLSDAYNQALNGRRSTNLITGGDETLDFNTGETIKDALISKSTILQGDKILTKSEAKEVSGNFFAGSMSARMNSNKYEVDKMYKKIWSAADAEQDVSNLYLDVTEVVDNIDSSAFTGVQNIARNDVNQFFNDALHDGTQRYFKLIGGGNAAEGKKLLTNVLKDKEMQANLLERGIDLTASTLNDPKQLAKIMLGDNREVLAGMFADSDLKAFALKIPTLEFKQGLSNIRSQFFELNISSKAGKNTSKEYINQNTLGKVLDAMEVKVDEIYARVSAQPGKSELIESTTNFYKTNIMDAKNNIMWRRTMGQAWGNDTKSITGFSHGTNSPQAWLNNELKMVTDSTSATDFWNNFESVFGTDVTDPYYMNALKSIDDTLMQDMAGKQYTYKAPFPTSRTKTLSGDDADILFSDTIIKESSDALGVPVNIIDEVKGSRALRELLSDNSSGKYRLGQTIDVYSKLKTAAETNAEARKEIINTLNRVDKLKVEYQDTVKGVQKGISQVHKFLATDAQDILKAADNTFIGVTDMFMTSPKTLEATKIHLINTYIKQGMTHSEATEETSRILKHIVGKGISNKFQGNQKQMVKQTSEIEGGKKQITGVEEPQGVFNVMEMNAYLNDHGTILRELLGDTHYEDIYFITNYMARNGYTTEVDAAAKFNLTETYQARKRGNVVFGPASIISRLYAAESGRTSYRYIGAEAVAAMMVNSKSDVLGAVFTNGAWSRGIKEFLTDSKMPSSYAKQKRIVWLEELAAYSSIIGEAIKHVAYSPFTDENLLPSLDYLKDKLGIDTSKKPYYEKKAIKEYVMIDGKEVLVDKLGESEIEIGDRITSKRDIYNREGKVIDTIAGKEALDLKESARVAKEIANNINTYKMTLPAWLKDLFTTQMD